MSVLENREYVVVRACVGERERETIVKQKDNEL
jgi:hypothetical protein